eukprot:5071042-Prymnesium_polylepis.2
MARGDHQRVQTVREACGPCARRRAFWQGLGTAASWALAGEGRILYLLAADEDRGSLRGVSQLH